MQRKVFLISAAIVVLALIVIGGFYVSKKSQRLQTGQQIAQATETQRSEQSGTIKSLLAMGKDVACDVSYSVGQNKTAGKVYVAGQKMSGDFTVTTSDGKALDTHMVQKDGYIYYWSSIVPQGTKMKIPTESESPVPAPGGVSTGFNADQQVQYRCSPWGADDSKFNLPANVQFTDVSAMTKSPGQKETTTTKPGASVCDSITDPQAKAACITAYSQ